MNAVRIVTLKRYAGHRAGSVAEDGASGSPASRTSVRGVTRYRSITYTRGYHDQLVGRYSAMSGCGAPRPLDPARYGAIYSATGMRQRFGVFIRYCVITTRRKRL